MIEAPPRYAVGFDAYSTQGPKYLSSGFAHFASIDRVCVDA